MGTAIHPPSGEDRDWRVWAGRLGRTLIGAGLLLLAFVAYQLWGTGIQQDRAQDRLSNRFADLSAQIATPPTAAPDDTTTDTTPDDTTPDDTTPDDRTPAVADGEAWTIESGDPIGVIAIPRLGVREFVVAGVDPVDLRKGPGHFPFTPLPGELGNAAIAGHRTTYGEPFAALDQLEPGDEIVVEMLGGGRYVYAVDSTRIVDPSQIDVIATTEPDVARITLTTCHPRWSAAQRLVVSGALVADTSNPPQKQPIVVSDAGNGTTDDDMAAVGDDATGASGDSDAFDAGWFSDPAAWPHAIAWSLVVLALGWAIWWLGRRAATRRRAAGRRWPVVGQLGAIALGAVPFLVCLYLAFENISRLLPPNL